MSLPNSSLIPEQELIDRLKRQDQAALALLYDNYAPTLYGVILRIVTVSEVAEDVLQECFVKIWLSFATYDATKGKLFTWLINIARNAAIDHIRSRSHRKDKKTQFLNYLEANKRIQTGGFKPEHVDLTTQLTCLSPQQHNIINLLYFAGYTQTEVAVALNIPLGTVKTRTRNALQRLRKLYTAKE